MASHHQFLQASDLIPLTLLSCTIDPLSQVLNPSLNLCPIDGVPVEVWSFRSDVWCDSILHGCLVPLQ